MLPVNKNQLIFLFLLLSVIASATTFDLGRIEKCEGVIKVKAYTDIPYTVNQCDYKGWVYECPCAVNYKLNLNSNIVVKTKVMVEYNLKLNDGSSRQTYELWLAPEPLTSHEMEEKNGIEGFPTITKEQTTIFAIIGIVVLLIIVFSILLLIKYIFNKLKSEDDE